MIELFLTARLSCVAGAGYYFLQATRGKHAKGRGSSFSFSPLARPRDFLLRLKKKNAVQSEIGIVTRRENPSGCTLRYIMCGSKKRKGD